MIYRFLEKTLAVVVIYNQQLNDSTTLQSLTKSLGTDNILEVIIYDNSKYAQSLDDIRFKNFRIHYIHNHENPGVSLAYNYGAEKAEQLKKEWLLILDQDTHFAEDFFDKMNQGILENPQIKLFAPVLKLSNNKILSPCKFNFFHGRHLKSVHVGVNSLRINQPVNSGLIISLKTFFLAGGYNNKVKLDFSDHQFIERIKKIENQYYVVDSEGEQDFSGMENDLQKIKNRFISYCNGAMNFETSKYYQRFYLHFFLGLKLLKISVKHKSLFFCKIYFNQLLKSKL